MVLPKRARGRVPSGSGHTWSSVILSSTTGWPSLSSMSPTSPTLRPPIRTSCPSVSWMALPKVARRVCVSASPTELPMISTPAPRKARTASTVTSRGTTLCRSGSTTPVQPPSGNRAPWPKNSADSTAPTKWIQMRLTIMERATALPTPTGPPAAR